jgi:tripartite-type tricarboxylate transporter receptor subunit TctC
MSLSRRSLVGAALAAPMLATSAKAQSLTHDVRLIVGFSPGGTVDMIGRLLAEGLQAQTGRNFVVENRTGASGFIGLQTVANAAPDGHTLSISSGFNLAVSPVLPGFTMPIDPDRELVQLAGLLAVPMVLVSRPDAPFRTFAEMVAYAKGPAGRLVCGTGGAGSSPHLMAARMAGEAGITLDYSPYRGGAPALLDLVASRYDIYVAQLPEALPQIQAGKMRPIAMTTAERHPLLPEVPLMKESLPGYVGGSWYALSGPKNLPEAWAPFWSQQIATVMQRPATLARARELMLDPMDPGTEAIRGQIAAERRIWKNVIDKAGIRID